MRTPSLDTVRLFLHVLAATIWVGGQFALAGVVPSVRRLAPDATRAVARAYGRVAWPAFAVLVVTGMWNLLAVDVTALDGPTQATLLVHLAVGIASGVFAAVHSFGGTRRALALGGALGSLTSVAAVFLGALART